MEKQSRINRIKIIGFQVLIFLTMFVFFTQISPLIPFDADDWLFNGTMRGPYPLWGAFNPTRVLPEILNPVAGYLAAFIVYPFTKDYVRAITLVDALIVSLFICLMLYFFFQLLRKRMRYSVNVSLAVETIFFLSFFLIFKHINQPSLTGFWTTDTTCAFFYLIPGLLNATIMLVMAQEENISLAFNKFNNPKRGIILLGLYFAMFSNSQFNIILATFSFVMLVKTIFQRNYKLFSMESVKASWLYLLILFLWLTTVLFDLNGGRSSNLGNGGNAPLISRVKQAVSSFRALAQATNKGMVGIIILIIILAIIMLVKSKQGSPSLFILSISLVSVVLTWLYLMIAYSKAIPNYAGRVDAMWPPLFYLLFAFAIALGYVINTYSIVKVLMPLAITLSILISFNFNCLPIPSVSLNTNPKIAMRIDNYIINQVIAADQAGKSEVTIKVPQGDVRGGNWPQSYYMASSLTQSLYAHRIINHRIKTRFVPDKNVTKKLNPAVNEVPFVPLEK